MITDRDVFNKVKTHLLAQNERSMLVSGSCAYRGVKHSDLDEVWMREFGTAAPLNIDNEPEVVMKRLREISATIPRNISCAVGCLIDERYYDHEFEARPADNEGVLDALAWSIPDWDPYDRNSIDMLLRLQAVHDEMEIAKWPEILNTFEFDEHGNFTDGGYFKISHNMFD